MRIELIAKWAEYPPGTKLTPEDALGQKLVDAKIARLAPEEEKPEETKDAKGEEPAAAMTTGAPEKATLPSPQPRSGKGGKSK